MALKQITVNIASFNDADAGGNNYFSGEIYEVFNLNGTLADIFSDAFGSNPINQDGISNVSDSSGEVLFFISTGNYYLSVGEKRRDFEAGDLDIVALQEKEVIQDDQILALQQGQIGGIIVFQTYAELDAYTPSGSAEEKTSYKVANDPDSSLNGYYSWVSGDTYTKDASLVVNVIDGNNTSDAVSGSAVSAYVASQKDTVEEFKSRVDDVVLGVNTGSVTDELIFGVKTPMEDVASADRAYFLEDKVTKDGFINHINIAVVGDGTLKLKRFKDSSDGLSYLFQNETSIPVVTGLNSISITPFQVERGDTLAFYNVGSTLYAQPDGGTGAILGKSSYKDDVTDVLKSSLFLGTNSLSMNLTIEYTVPEYLSKYLVTEFNEDADLEFPSSKAIAKKIESEINSKNLTDIIMVPCYGQSLSIGTSGGSSTFSNAVSIAFDQTGANNNIQDMNGGYAEMFKELADEFSPLPAQFKMMTCLGGAGGRSILELSKGTTYYNTVLSNISEGAATAAILGQTYSVPAIMWTQGEEDMRTDGDPTLYGTGIYDPFDYGDRLKQLIDDFNEDIKVITGQKNDVKMIMYQVASHNVYARYPRIAIEQLQACTTHENLIMSKTMYDVDYVLGDQVHAPNKTYRKMGNNYGISLYRSLVLEEKVLPIFPTKSTLIGNDLFIKFHVDNPPLSFDTATVAPIVDGNYGFDLYQVTSETDGANGVLTKSTTLITNVELVKDDVVKITFDSTPPTGHRLTYGVNGLGSESINGTKAAQYWSGRVNGARGNLKENITYFNSVDDYFYLDNFAPIFEIVM